MQKYSEQLGLHVEKVDVKCPRISFRQTYLDIAVAYNNRSALCCNPPLAS
jgi:hypothetical protein